VQYSADGTDAKIRKSKIAGNQKNRKKMRRNPLEKKMDAVNDVKAVIYPDCHFY
jgi:hypothetical protein